MQNTIYAGGVVLGLGVGLVVSVFHPSTEDMLLIRYTIMLQKISRSITNVQIHNMAMIDMDKIYSIIILLFCIVGWLKEYLQSPCMLIKHLELLQKILQTVFCYL